MATQFQFGGSNLARFDIPVDVQTLLDNLDTGDRWIFKAARPATVGPTDHAVDAGAAAWSFDLPQPTVTHTPATPAGVVSVTVPLTGVSVLTTYIRWSDNYSLGSLFSADGAEQILSLVDLNSSSPAGRVVISISGINRRFTPAFEASGQIIFEASDGETLEVTIGNADMSEIYQWTPANSLEVVAFVDHIRTLTDQSGTLTLRGEGTGVTDHSANAGDASWAFAVPEPTVTHTPVVTNDYTVNAGDAAFAFALPQPTVTHTAAPTVQLVLSDSDDTGLDVEAKALLVASAAATVAGDIFWADADRGGTDTPLDGELGLGATNTVISRFRRVSASVLALTHDSNPSALDLAAYFGAGGDGNDLALYFQTLSGAVSFSVAAQLGNAGDNWAQFTLPADAQTLLDGIASGARFIFKAARPVTVSADHAVDAGDAAFAFALPQPSVTHTLASGAVDHSVGAGDIAFTFALTQPTRTHIQAVSDDHAVNAGDLNWGFDVPRPTVTHTTVVTQAHAVNAVGLSWTFDLTAAARHRRVHRRHRRDGHRIHRRRYPTD